MYIFVKLTLIKDNPNPKNNSENSFLTMLLIVV